MLKGGGGSEAVREETGLLAFRKKLGLKLDEILDPSEEGLEHPAEQLGLFSLGIWEPLKLLE